MLAYLIPFARAKNVSIDSATESRCAKCHDVEPLSALAIDRKY